MDKLIEEALKRHKIVRYIETFEKVMLTYKGLLEAEVKNISKEPMLVDDLSCSHRYSKSMNQTYPRKCIKCGEPEITIEPK